MAVRKNPDWTVWLADVWHWARQPPGIYIVIISFMACGLLYAYTPRPQPPAIQVVRQQPSMPSVPSVPRQQSSPSRCDVPLSKYDDRVQKCVTYQQLPRDSCPTNYDYDDYMAGCVLVMEYDHWDIEPNSSFNIDGSINGPVVVKIQSGNVVAQAGTAQNKYTEPKIYNEGQIVTFKGTWNLSSTNGANITAHYQSR